MESEIESEEFSEGGFELDSELGSHKERLNPGSNVNHNKEYSEGKYTEEDIYSLVEKRLNTKIPLYIKNLKINGYNSKIVLKNIIML